MNNPSIFGSLFSVIKMTFSGIVLSSILVGCASNSNRQTELQISVNPSALKSNPGDMSFWLVFAMAQPSCGEDYPAYSYGEYACAFKLASLISSQTVDSSEEPKSEFQVDLAKIVGAGFIDEYIFYYYHQDNWFQEPNLKTELFQNWMKSNLVKHRPSNDRSVSVKRSEIILDESKISQVQLDQTFETAIGNLFYVGQKRYDQPSLGISLRYQVVSREDSWLDFYIYPKIRTKKGLLNRNGLVDEASTTKSSILYYAQKDKVESIQVLEESSNSDVNFLKGSYEIVRNGTAFIDELYIAGNEKYFLKARGTFHKGHKDYSDNEIKAVFQSLLASVK